jgi:hypothetical protein
MTDTATQHELEIGASPTKREAIELELRNDADRSDREIARVVGCDHKTVAARRREMGIAPPLGNSPPSPDEFRSMLANGIRDFDDKCPPESADDTVDRMIADGKINHATAGSGGEGTSHASRVVQATPGVTVLCAQQDEIEISFDEDGDAIITQKRWPDEDQTIIISRENIDTFIDRLTDALGIPSFGRP